MSEKTVRICDLCNQDICEAGSGNAMVYSSDNYQVWNSKDICHSCCLILNKARLLGLIEFEYQALLDQAELLKSEEYGERMLSSDSNGE